MARTSFILLTVLVALYVGVCAALFFFQRSMIYFPQPRSLPADQSVLTLQTADANLVLTVYETDSPKALIYYGGNAEDVSLSLPELRSAFPGSAL